MTLKTTTECECGGHYSSRENKITHLKSLRHKKYLETGIKHNIIYFCEMTKVEKHEAKKQYIREYYSKNKEIWMNCPSRKHSSTHNKIQPSSDSNLIGVN